MRFRERVGKLLTTQLPPWRTAAVLVVLFWLVMGVYYGLQPLVWRNFGAYDWLAYWSTPRAALLGDGFFDWGWLRAVQSSHGYDQTYVGPYYYPVWRLWNPSFVTLLWLPLAWLPFTLSTYIWNGLSLFLFVGAALELAHSLGSRAPDLITLLLIMTVSSAYDVLETGQFGMALGAFFVLAWLAHQRRHALATGLLLSLQVVKPQLLWIAVGLLLWISWRRGNRVTVVAFGSMVASLLLLSIILDPQWPIEWIRSGSPTQFPSFSFGDLVKGVLHLPYWVRFIGPTVAALLALLLYLPLRSVDLETLGEVSLLSFFFGPYYWRSDFSVLLIAIVWMIGVLWRSKLHVVALISLALAFTATMALPYRTGYWLYFPLMLCFALLWFQARRLSRQRKSCLPDTIPAGATP